MKRATVTQPWHLVPHGCTHQHADRSEGTCRSRGAPPLRHAPIRAHVVVWILIPLLVLTQLLDMARPAAVRGTEPQRADVAAAPFFGMTAILPDRFTGLPGMALLPWSRLARDAGARVNRWQFSWPQMERSRGLVDPSSVDPAIAAAAANDFVILGVLVGTPSWAAGGEAGQPPANLELPFTHPDNHWARFVYNMVLHYRDRVRYWEIWNEPNLREFWSGSPEQYYRLLKVAYQAARAADPTALVLFGGLSGQDTVFLERVLQVGDADPEAEGAGHYFDVFAWHAYSRATQHHDGTVAFRDQLARHGLSKPIWITESNIPAWNDPSICGENCAPTQWEATAEEQASYILQAFGYGLAAGVRHMSIYRASDVGEASAWGLLRNDGAARPAYHAYSTVHRYLDGAETATLFRGEGFERVEVLAPGRRVSLAWSTGPAVPRARIEAVGARAILVDKHGNWIAVQPDQEGFYNLYLPAATNNSGLTARDYVVGGEPYLVVQSR